MTAMLSDIKAWFDEGVNKGATHMLVVWDSFSFEPKYVMPDEDPHAKVAKHSKKNKQVKELYNLRLSRGIQLSQHRAWNY